MLFLNLPLGTVKNTPAAVTNRRGSAVFVSKALASKYDDSPAEIPVARPPEPIIRHPEFFFDNTLIAIQIENTLFNVHKYQLAKSDLSSKIFNLPQSEGNELEEGSSPEHPIVIHGTAASDFAALLKVLYASQFSSNQLAPEASLVVPAFRLANLLDFSELRAYLLPLAEKNLDDVDKIVFAREFDIKDWLAPAFIRLCQRDAVLSTDEARKLGTDGVLMIWRTREHYRSQTEGKTPALNTVYRQGCAGWRYLCTSSGTCKQCYVTATAPYLAYDGPGKIVGKTITDENELEAEVKKWVEEGNAMRAT